MSHPLSRGQPLRFNRKGDPALAKATAKASAASAAALLARRNALLQDYNKLHHKPAWSPTYTAAIRFLLIIRVASAMYSIINDCDETYNYWEPLHLLVFTPKNVISSSNSTVAFQSPFQTWEYSPEFAIRSWAYLVQYLPLAKLLAFLGTGKRQVFFAIRILLAFTCTLIEARFYKAVAETFNSRVGRYCLVALAAGAGMFQASTALLPSSFAMYANMLAFSFSLYPARLPSNHPSVVSTPTQRPFQRYRLLGAVASFAAGAIVGWPFALILSLPFVIEQLFLRADDVVPANRLANWYSARLSTFIGAVALSSTLLLPVFVMDTLAYGKAALVPLNIISYNLFSKSRGAGPELYGTEPFSYYFSNLFLNFNLLFVLALASAPLLALTLVYDPKRLRRPLEQAVDKKGHVDQPEPSNFSLLVALRLAPFYMWFLLLSFQPHKEERFMYPAYPLLCMNAAVALYLVRSLFETFYVKVTKSPYKASKSKMFTTTTSFILIASLLLGTLRIVGQLLHYHAPMDVLFHLESFELPRVVANLFPETLSPVVQARIVKGLSPVASESERDDADRGYYLTETSSEADSVDLSIDLTPLNRLSSPLRLCYGKEWHRFPSHFLVPAGVQVDFIKSEFKGILPKHFDVSVHGVEFEGGRDSISNWFDQFFGKTWIWKDITRRVQLGFNDLNQEETDRYISQPLDSCDYLVDVDFPHRHDQTNHEPRYITMKKDWEPVFCSSSFLDTEWSRGSKLPNDSMISHWIFNTFLATFHRSFWLPFSWPGNANKFGDYCLLRNRHSHVVSLSPPSSSSTSS